MMVSGRALISAFCWVILFHRLKLKSIWGTMDTCYKLYPILIHKQHISIFIVGKHIYYEG
jgi:hypothetical protein